MRETGFLYTLGIVLLATFSVVVESGLLVTSPRIIRSGSTHKLAVSLVAVKEPWKVNATLRNSWGNIICTDEDEFGIDTDGTLKLEIPRDLETGGRTELSVKLSVTAGPKGNRNAFQKSESVTLEIAKKTIFIQTDKPIYKPGQTIRMRIVGVDENLRPLKGKVSRVSIINPSGVRTMQWDNIDLTLGMASLMFPLSSQPVLGNWKIKATIEGLKKTQVVGVEKYVLPKFKVTIEPPSFVAADTREVTATICAKYTYGQPVVGKVKVLFQVKKRYYRRDSGSVKVTAEKEINGCTDVTISNADLQLSQKNRYYLRVLAINATVTEKATGVAQNATGTQTDVENHSAKLEFLPTTPKTFKRGMPFRGQFQATKQDGSPLSGEQVDIVVKGQKYSGGNRYSWYPYYYDTRELLRMTFTVPATGVVDFDVPDSLLPISSTYKTLVLTAQLTQQNKVRAVHYAQLWYSPSNSYIEMERMTAPVKVGSVAKVNFSFTADNSTDMIHFHYQVVSRGKLVNHGSEWQNIKRGNQLIKTGAFQFTVIQEMVPSCRLLLFYVRDDRETVAANLVLDVEDALENQVSVSFADETRKPGEATSLIISAAPGSQVAVTVVDKSVLLLRQGNELTEDDAISVLNSQDVGSSGTLPCNSPPWSWRRNKRSFFPGVQRRDMDAAKAFDDTGMIYFSDLKIATSICRRRYTSFLLFSEGPFIAGSAGPLEEVPQARFLNLREDTRTAKRRKTTKPKPLRVRKEFPETWLWTEEMVRAASVLEQFPVPRATNSIRQELAPDALSLISHPKKKKKETKPRPLKIRKEFPETWLWTEEIVNEKTGKTVIMAKVPDTITSWTASAFGMSDAVGLGVSKPASIKVFQPFFVSLTLPYSVIRGEEVSIITSVFNYMSQCLSIRLDLLDSSDYKISSFNSHKVCVCSNEAKSVAFTILPKNLGHINLTVVAKNIDSSVCKKDVKQVTLGITDAVSRKLLVEPEGVREEYTYNNFFCLTDKSTFKDTIDISLPENVVPGSVHAVVSTVGDIMGPALNVGSMLRLPYGCGEQNMINFAPSIYIMKYLSSVDQLSQSLENKAKQIMTIGYQRELSYKRKDGSYSAFGDYDSEGNMWLTAFVLRSFSQARRFIFVDEEELKATTAWITKHQQPNGCFPKVGRLFNKRMKGGVSTEVTLTAFIAVSLLEMGMTPKDEVIQGALRCVVSSSANATDSYSTALFAYTLALAKDPRRSSYFKTLQEKAIKEGDLLHWENENTQKPNPRFPWRWYYRAPAADIEMTGYALMTYVSMAEEDDGSLIAQAMPIVRWLSKQRNSLGGFASTQDTCVALQALGKYASQVYSNNSDLSVRFGEEDHPRFNPLFTINSNNRLVLQRAEVPSELLPRKALPVEAQGSGCALVQADVSYNIPEVQEEPAFDLSVKVKRVDDVLASPLTTETGEELCGPLEMQISARWLREDSSNMAVIDIKLVSGFQADEESLDRLTNKAGLGFKRKEIDGTHVILYFDEIEKVSFSFKIYQTSIVKKTKPASVTVYDYYEPHLTATEMYKIHSELCDPYPEVVPAKCPTCVKELDYKKMLPTLCKTKKVYAVYVGKNDDAFYKEIPKPKNVTTGADSNITSNASDGKENFTSIRFELGIPAECQCALVRPGSQVYVFVDGVNLLPIGENALFVRRDSVNLGTLRRNMYGQCPRRDP